MLLTIVVILVILWALGMISGLGGFIHILLVIALVFILLRVIAGEKL